VVSPILRVVMGMPPSAGDVSRSCQQAAALRNGRARAAWRCANKGFNFACHTASRIPSFHPSLASRPSMDLHFITDLGDQAVILPLVVATGLVLLLAGWWRGAAAWFLAVPATLGAVLVGKLSTMACHDLLPPVGLLSPSGHTASAAVVYGGVLALTLGGPLAAAVSAASVGALVGYTRLALDVHTPADVIVGALIGIAGAVVLSVLAGPRPRLRQRWIGVAAAMIAVLVLFHGRHVYAEMHINRMSQQIWPLSLCVGP
jgi:membrane-associated phospholipid phosphatase